MREHVVLVEPNYYSSYPPIGLLKLSSYEKNQGNTTELVRKSGFPKKKPDKIYITSLFTWAWKPVWDAIRSYKARYPETEIWLGGLYASLLPEHAKRSGVDHIVKGLHLEAEEMLPDYSLVPNWDGSIIFASRGCNNNCLYCAVPKLEGKICLERVSIKKFVWPSHTKLIFFDNNILAMKYWKRVFKEIISLNKTVDFNQGLDARLITEEAATIISKMVHSNIGRKSIIRLAYDGPSHREPIKRSIKMFSDKGIDKRQIIVYTLYNFNESPEEYLFRVLEILENGSACYPMRFQPCVTLKKNSHVSQKWTAKQLDMVERAIRVIGYGGVFPPYKGLVKKFKQAQNFDEAFSLYPKQRQDKKAKEENYKQLERTFNPRS